MCRRLITSCALIVGVLLVMSGRTPLVEEAFVTTTEAAEAAEGTLCLMPDAVDGAPAVVSDLDPTGQSPIPIPQTSDAERDNLPPVRMVVDPYPSFNGVAVDATNDLLLMSDTNRKSLLLYGRTASNLTSRDAARPRQRATAARPRPREGRASSAR